MHSHLKSQHCEHFRLIFETSLLLSVPFPTKNTAGLRKVEIALLYALIPFFKVYYNTMPTYIKHFQFLVSFAQRSETH